MKCEHFKSHVSEFSIKVFAAFIGNTHHRDGDFFLLSLVKSPMPGQGTSNDCTVLQHFFCDFIEAHEIHYGVQDNNVFVLHDEVEFSLAAGNGRYHYTGKSERKGVIGLGNDHGTLNTPDTDKGLQGVVNNDSVDCLGKCRFYGIDGLCPVCMTCVLHACHGVYFGSCDLARAIPFLDTSHPYINDKGVGVIFPNPLLDKLTLFRFRIKCYDDSNAGFHRHAILTGSLPREAARSIYFSTGSFSTLSIRDGSCVSKI